MGAGESKNSNRKINDYNTFEIVMNDIASEYIQTMNFGDMLDLQDPEKSKKLLILTQDIISKELEKYDIVYDEKMKDAMGVVDEKKEDTIFTATKEELANLKLSHKTHQVLATALAKKYLKIANIFAAIYVVLHPEYETQVCTETTTNTNTGKREKRRICKPKSKTKHDKKEQMYFMRNKPEGAPIENFCHKRLQALIGKGSSNDITSEQGITVAPTLCDFGKNMKTGAPLKFEEEPGILELDALYYDKYSDATKDFTERSPKMEKELQEDATAFFEAIVGMKLGEYNKKLKQRNPQATPKQIKTFADVTMRSLYDTEGCLPISDKINTITNSNGLRTAGIGSYRHSYTGDSDLFRKYGAHLKAMKENAENNYMALTGVIEAIFVKNDAIANGSNVSTFRIRPGIKDSEIDDLLAKTRQLISKMYIQCADDFRTGISLFKKIVAETISKQHKKILEGQASSVEDAMRIANEKTGMEEYYKNE